MMESLYCVPNLYHFPGPFLPNTRNTNWLVGKPECGCAEQWCEHRSADLGSKGGNLDRTVWRLTAYQVRQGWNTSHDRTLFYFDGVPVWETIGTQTTLRDHTISQLMRGR